MSRTGRLVIAIAILFAQQWGEGGGPQLEEKSSAPSHAQKVNVGVLNLICLVGAKIQRPRESVGSEQIPKGRAEFRLLMPSRAHDTFLSQLQCVCGDKWILRWSAAL